MKGRAIQYSEKELEWVKDNCTLPISSLHQRFCDVFSRTDVNATNLAALRKRNGWRTGRTGQFEKGNIPHPNARPKGANSTSFKRGHKPHNWKPVGSTRVSKDGYIEVKVAEPKKWELAHIVEWEKHHGPVPDGFCISMIDNVKTNTDISNLELITRNANLQINRLKGKLPVNEATLPVIKNIGKLVAKTIDVEKGVNRAI